MGQIWKKDGLYTFLLPYVNFGIRRTYRHFEVEGVENIPEGVPVILVANHSATLMDALVVLCTAPRTVAFGARADMFRNPRAAAVLNWLRIVPMARARDGREALQEASVVMEEVIQCIGNGALFCLYPEGTHFPDQEVHTFKKGAARIAMHAAQELGKKVYVVPVGLQYSDFFRFKADVRVKYGKPVEVSEDADMLELTARLQEDVTALASYSEHPFPERGSRGLLDYALALLLFPLFIFCAVVALPLLLVEALIIAKLKDKAWSTTVRFAVSLLFFLHWPFHSLYHLMLNFYKDLIQQ